VIRSSRTAALPLRMLIVAVAGLLPVLAGCEAGTNAPTQEWHQPTAGAGTQLGQIAIRNVFILGPPLGATLPKGQSAGLFVGLVNSGSPDRLVSVTAPTAATSVTLPGGSVPLPTRTAVLLTGPAPKIILTGLIRPLSGGTSVPVTLSFQNAGSITLQVPVMPKAQYFATYSAAPSPSPSRTAKKAGRKPKSGSATPSPSPSGTG
jgi:copper(I)-binding protein